MLFRGNIPMIIGGKTMSTVQVIPQTIKRKTLIRTAAYARVSMEKETAVRSLSAQVDYYTKYIQSNPDYEMAGIYIDEAKSGTKDTRENFVRLLEDCESGKIDLIITKSVSRFSRNTVDLLSTCRRLKELGIDVYFESQNIHALSSEGEMMLTLLASMAQEEARSDSENMRWAVRKRFEEGIPWCGALLGYRLKNGRYEIVPMEAELVRRIYADYLKGDGIETITNALNQDKELTRRGYHWHKFSVDRILRNYTYTGNLILQTTYSENYITKIPKKNKGEMPMYFVEDAHEAIISEEDYNKVQDQLRERTEKYKPTNKSFKPYPYTGLITCGNCGKHYRRKTTATGHVWICTTYNTKGKAACASKQIPETTLDQISIDIPLDSISQITAFNGNILVFRYKDGTELVRHWKDRSRAESWTPEMKEQARRDAKRRNR